MTSKLKNLTNIEENHDETLPYNSFNVTRNSKNNHLSLNNNNLTNNDNKENNKIAFISTKILLKEIY